MKRELYVILGVSAGLAVSVQAQTTADRVVLAQNPAVGKVVVAQGAPRLAENTPVVVVEEISSEPKSILNENKIQVAVGPAKMDYTLHLSDAKMYDRHGAVIKADQLAGKIWIRAEGKIMDDSRRVMVSRLQVVGQDLPGLKQSAFYRPGFDQGYVMAVAGARQIFPAVDGTVYTPAAITIVGRVSDDTGPLEATRHIQVDAAGNIWTLNVLKDTPLFDAQGKKISVHEIAKDQWIRAHGWQTDDLRMRVARLQEIGPQSRPIGRPPATDRQSRWATWSECPAAACSSIRSGRVASSPTSPQRPAR